MKRFILLKEGEEIGRFKTVKQIALEVGCSFQHVYKGNDGCFKYKKINYQVIDRLKDLD
jgi:hypothetical protein